MKLGISIYGEARHTPNSSISWTKRVDFTTSVGEMLRFTASEPLYLPRRNRSISLTTLDIDTSLSNTAHKAKLIDVVNAGAIRQKTLVGNNVRCSQYSQYTDISSADYEWYSCLSRYDKMF